MKDLSGLGGKVENEGTTKKGRISAHEFNTLIEAAIESQDKINVLEKYFIPISKTEYERLSQEGEIEEGRPYFIYEEDE